jgi:putative ABC transport system permease protein
VKYLRFLRVNLLRKKIRTGLTIGSFAIAMLLFGLLVIIRFAFNQGVEVAGADRLIVMNRVTFIEPLPISYMDRIAAMPGVKAVTHATWFGGTYQDPKNFFPQFAVEPESWHLMYPEYLVSDDQWKAFLDDRQAAIAGAGIAKQYGWKIGDRIPIEGTIFPGNWQFNLVGIYGNYIDDFRTI